MKKTTNEFGKAKKTLAAISAIFMSASFCLLPDDPALAQEAAAKQQPQAETVTAAGEKSSDIIKQMARLVQDVQGKIGPILEELQQKQLDIEQAGARYDAAMADLKKIAALAGPGGELEKRIEALQDIGDKAIARLEHHPNPKLRKLVDSVYKPKMDELKKQLEALKNVHGDILTRIEELETEKETVIELSRASLYKQAVDLVKSGVDTYKGMKSTLTEIGEKVGETEETFTQ